MCKRGQGNASIPLPSFMQIPIRRKPSIELERSGSEMETLQRIRRHTGQCLMRNIIIVNIRIFRKRSEMMRKYRRIQIRKKQKRQKKNQKIPMRRMQDQKETIRKMKEKREKGRLVIFKNQT